MTPRKVGEYLLVGLVLLLVGSLLLGQLLGQPVLLSYVETGSMRPQLQPGDGFIAIPAAVAGPIEEGDVITFDAENLNNGNLVTHRVVEETEQGFITKGDANPTTDQDGNEPPVKRPQIVAVALQIGGRIVVIPNLGIGVVAINSAISGFQQTLASTFNTRALLGTEGMAYILFGFGVFSYVFSELFADEGERARTREVDRRREGVSDQLILAVLTVLLVGFVTASMVVPAGTQEFSIVSSTTDAPGIQVIERGTSETVTYRVPSNGIIPVVVFLEPGSDGISMQPRELYVPSNSVRESIVEIKAPSQTGAYRRYLIEHRYLAVLPQGTIRYLHQLHPWLPVIVIDLLLAIGFAGLGSGLISGGRARARSRDLPLTERVRRWFR
ncbi:MAG: signal peptidase I [Halobacteriales archaeon]